MNLQVTTNSSVERGTIYTLGASQRQASATLERLLRQPHILLLDVRSQPIARWHQGCSQADLAVRYGKQYRWERRFISSMHARSRERAFLLPENAQEAVHEAASLLGAGT